MMPFSGSLPSLPAQSPDETAVVVGDVGLSGTAKGGEPGMVSSGIFAMMR